MTVVVDSPTLSTFQQASARLIEFPFKVYYTAAARHCETMMPLKRKGEIGTPASERPVSRVEPVRLLLIAQSFQHFRRCFTSDSDTVTLNAHVATVSILASQGVLVALRP